MQFWRNYDILGGNVNEINGRIVILQNQMSLIRNVEGGLGGSVTDGCEDSYVTELWGCWEGDRIDGIRVDIGISGYQVKTK